ncbi:MAG TPA: LCP family protein, partial [Propionibacteriaceae bacterium]|nr:LCP family protein [Propionibacteriaceae bacterium]
MADPREENRRNADMDWLYRDERPEQTRIMPTIATPPVAGSTPPPPAAPWATVPHATQPRATQPPASPPPASPPAKRGGRGRRTRRRRFRVVRWLLVLVLAWLVWLVGVPVFAWTQAAVVDASPMPRPASQPGTAVLLVGSDSREDDTSGSRADTMMVLVTPTTGPSVLVSLPRDSYVDIPGRGKNKLNAAYAFGGPKLLVNTVEQATGLEIDGYLEVGFDGFVDVIDAVGGIRMCLDDPMKDADAHIDLPAGCQTLEGADALGYVRMRKSDPKGDLGRIERQREMLAALTTRAASPMTVLNPVRWWRLNMAAAGSLHRSDTTGLRDIGGVAAGMASISLGRGLTLTVPVADANATTSAGSSVL